MRSLSVYNMRNRLIRKHLYKDADRSWAPVFHPLFFRLGVFNKLARQILRRLYYEMYGD